ncbi:MAG TPA: helicase-exonuclease AddAB subunit AddA [Mobilitalea sp.]|nr:helicase-exonuclease AddAB subunit AddA [Mobilitalea sp.]
MTWTEAQQKVIDTRNKNLLVSAAAGSGKTAVLVERIISMISEGESPIDIDHLLVVTFTNAAAAQMRERIGKALDKKLLLEPDNLHLQKQISLLQSAQITTIHSFCLNVIRNYFHMIDLDPSFKMADESEITLMKSDVMGELLEHWYEEGGDDFHEFIESYSYSKSDLPVEELVLQLYHFSMSNPWPKVWLTEIQEAFEINTLEEMESTKWMQELLRYVQVVISDLTGKNEEAINVCNEADGPGAYLAAILSDREMINKMKSINTYKEYADLFGALSYARLSSKKEEGVAQGQKDKVKELREDFKKGMKDLTNQFFFQSPEEMLKDLQEVKGVMRVLLELTLDFMDQFAAKKEEKNLIDFNDLEHFALNILVEEADSTKAPSRAALELSELFEEVLIDEYQDSNLVQETILKSISREQIGISNRFMVGDVKQSIYKFRLAMPELFMNKYRTYGLKDTLESGEVNNSQRIDLDKNFRSRKVVLDCVNAIFEQIMMEPVGGIIYDDAASLKYGELFEELILVGQSSEKSAQDREVAGSNLDRIAQEVELLLVTEEEATDSSETSLKDTSTEEDAEEAVYTKKELEARAIAARIKELVNPDTGMLLFDRETLTYHPACYRDIVILLRSMSGWSELFVNVLMQEGIPAYAETGTGYFQTLEIMNLLNMLRIIDNPRQDIPFVGVLYSPIVGLSTTELALIRIFSRNCGMYQAVCNYAKEGGEKELQEKLVVFMTMFQELRSMVEHTPIHELIEEVLSRTGYYYYVLAMQGGDRRKANIDMLVNQAVRFEKGSYVGLFHFIRYIEKLHKYEVDFGEASTSGEHENTVRIMSIHKSKGLEFPVVFVAGLSKQFNTQDLKNSIVIHADYGVGPEYIDSKLRTKVPTLLKKVIQKKIQVENLGEELRVLYVAMTRAKEKLILSGYIKSTDDIRKKDFSFFELVSSKSYMELVLPAVLNRMGNIKLPNEGLSCEVEGGFSISLIRKNEIIQEELTKQIFLQKDEEILKATTSEEVYDSGVKEEIKSRFNYSYPFKEASGVKVKMSVSELKKLGQFIDEEDSEHLYKVTSPYNDEDNVNINKNKIDSESNPMDAVATVPDFILGSQKQTTGTDRGTLYHKVLELLDLRRCSTREGLLRELDRMVLENKIKNEEIIKLKLDYIMRFANSSVAARMLEAQSAGKLYKEKQFVIGLNASEVIKDQKSDEIILVQGIIDVFFEEDGEIVLLDYKSDIVESEQELVKRYEVQLIYYRKALEQILKKRVKEMIIYSLYLGKEISC